MNTKASASVTIPMGMLRKLFALEIRRVLRVGLQIDHIISDQRKHQPVGIDAGAAKHAAH